MTSRVPMVPPFCNDHSWSVGEPLIGSAPRFQTVLILEVNGRWEPSVLDSAGVPGEVRERLRDLEKTLPEARVWFIRRGKESKAGASMMFYVALVRESSPALYAFRLSGYADLLSLDIEAVVAESPVYAEHRQEEPLMLVCTHGRRDRCCARVGQPVYERLAGELGSAVWQVSHVGGHRLAANVVVLPHGLYYGRVDRLGEDWAGFVDGLRSGRIALEAYRGRACYARPAQAAEYFARQSSGVTAWDAWTLVGVEQQQETAWRVEFAEASGARHIVHLRAADAVDIYTNCGDQALEPVIPLVLAGYENHAAP